MKVYATRSGEKTIYQLWCPACSDVVCIDNTWGWNGDTERPTFAPSLLTRHNIAGRDHVCHAFVTEGEWMYLDDSTHDLAGQSAPVVDLPEWAVRE